MKKIILALCLTVITSALTFAQASDDYKKVEGYVGYSNGQVDTGLDSGGPTFNIFRERENFNGFNASGVYNVTRYLGIKADVSGTYNSNRFSDSFTVGANTYSVSVKNRNSLYNFLGGVQVKDNSNKGTFKPFVHALVGAGHARAKISDYTCTPSVLCPVPSFGSDTFSETGVAGAFGGGIDIRLNNKIQIRAIQLDYNPVRLDGTTRNNVRIGAGIVF